MANLQEKFNAVEEGPSLPHHAEELEKKRRELEAIAQKLKQIHEEHDRIGDDESLTGDEKLNRKNEVCDQTTREDWEKLKGRLEKEVQDLEAIIAGREPEKEEEW